MVRKNCIYCNKQITTRSSEHIIHNALGGLLESEDICCPECNNFISKHIDAPFTKIFNPIIGRINNFAKTNNTKSMPAYTGKVIYNGKTYDANIKGNKVVSCPELSKEQRCDISKLPIQIITNNFELNNDALQTGIAKIAFNYAISQNVDFEYINGGLYVEKNGNTVEKIEYKYPIIPFCPMNPIDSVIELENNMDEPFHSMILFSQHTELWCYINLFNTFQYYVLLSNKMPVDKHIYANYTQTLQKLYHGIPNLGDLKDPKDIMIVAQQYGVEPCMDQQQFMKKLNAAAAKKSQIVSMNKIISPKMNRIPFQTILEYTQKNLQQSYLFYNALQLYFANNTFQEQNFRVWTPTINDSGVTLYPHEIAELISNKPEMIQKYTTMKFNNLNQYLNYCGR